MRHSQRQVAQPQQSAYEVSVAQPWAGLRDRVTTAPTDSGGGDRSWCEGAVAGDCSRGATDATAAVLLHAGITSDLSGKL